ncbi:MAG: UDP-N-acetylglucosamine--N-acetylmuramyl-(pentapeptide) pyrophosphoryl-undecaprenol N-acetylglucosamine transferase, partial [Candidatus Krumholzibacteria bacterium]|nr:UDP-N-acetylglucosamine--N-acetylmuramyl-(pentapeptide) pyrophosphoryl-undecaprenol N-acetylglucosamine transferase [Candidatus Krumholzibacteria bacterium]
EGLPFAPIPARPWRGRNPLQRILFLWDLLRAWFLCIGHLRRFRPDAVLATGSYVSLPVVLAARSLRIPYFLQEQNRVPGKVNLWMASRAREIYAAFRGTEEHFPKSSCLVFGNPLRPSFLNRETGEREEGPPRLLVFGGSRGASRINRAVMEALPALLKDLAFTALLQTGEEELEEVRSALAVHDSIEVFPYLDDMPRHMAEADLLLCRAGAMSLAELTVCGLPAILVPYPHAVDDHQTRNAEMLVEAGAALLLPDSELQGRILSEALRPLLSDRALREKMALASASLAKPDAASRILDSIEKYLSGRGADDISSPGSKGEIS